MTCIECQTSFAVTDADKTFYTRIHVPEPKNCPDCRLRRKLAFRNERTLYSRTCDACAKTVISLYTPKSPFPMYCSECWYGDSWSGYDHGKDFDFSRLFFDQLKELRDRVPHLATTVLRESCVNSDYCSWFDESRDCYLCFGSTKLEECMYSELLYNCKNTFDSTSSSGLERCYNCVDSSTCYSCVWGVRLQNCTDCTFSYDLSSCTNCLFCTNLRHKENMLFNEKVSPERLKEEKEKIFGSRQGTFDALKRFKHMLSENSIHKYASLLKSEGSTGNNLVACGSSLDCYDSTELENCKNVSYGDRVKDCQDCYAVVHGSELCYDCFSHNGAVNAQWNVASWTNSYNIQYCMYTRTSHDLFGCVGIQNGEYSIFNKQYSESDYKALREKIITHMKETGEWGGFFPYRLSPFGYNETIAIDYFPVMRDEALSQGCNWQDQMPGVFGKETVKGADLADILSDADTKVLSDIVSCAACNKNYKIIKKELEFYQTSRLPLPHQCPDCRYRLRLTFRTPRHLWRRQCMCDIAQYGHRAEASAKEGSRCVNEFETTFAPDRPEKVYCEECYQKEVI